MEDRELTTIMVGSMWRAAVVILPVIALWGTALPTWSRVVVTAAWIVLWAGIWPPTWWRHDR